MRRRGRAQRAARAIGVGQRLEEIAADDPEQIDVAVPRRARSSRPPSSPASTRTGNPQTSAHRAAVAGIDASARSRLRRRPARRSGRGSARGRDCGRPGRPRARPTFTSALIVSTPCACCVSPIDQTKTAFGRSIEQPRERLASRSRGAPLSRSSAAQSARQRRGRAPPRTRSCARGRTPRRRRRVSTSARKHADEKREVAARVDVEPVVGERACRTARSSAIDGIQ